MGLALLPPRYKSGVLPLLYLLSVDAESGNVRISVEIVRDDFMYGPGVSETSLQLHYHRMVI